MAGISMDIGNISSSYYKYNLDASLSPLRIMPTRQDFLLIDTVMGIKTSQKLIASQDPGEYKHKTIDKKSEQEAIEEEVLVPIIKQSNPSTTAEQAYKYRSFSSRNLLKSRKTLENSVRTIKRQRLECPYRYEDYCTKVFIRCGERLQYSMRESFTQQIQPHKCTYSYSMRGTGILIVDRDEHIRNFCKHSLAIFTGYDDSDITSTDSVSEAIELLNRSKLDYGKKYSLIIIDGTLPNNGGYWLVNELFIRNYDTSIILTKDESMRFKPPEDYLGNVEIAPSVRFVSIELTKPFHSEALLDALKKTGYIPENRS